MIDHRPALIVRCASIDDVVTAIRTARERDLEIGVRCGGHNVAGLAVPHGGLMIDLTGVDRVAVDPVALRARVQGGAMLGALDRASQRFGLATTAGNVSHTGVGGLTLGGGMGWLARRHGLACDNVVSCTVVTANGELVCASADQHPDLFWGLRGGGGNFGIVVEFEFRLHAIGTRTLVADLTFPLDRAAGALRGWRDVAEQAPREATLTAGISGDTVTLGYVWVGDPDDGRSLLPALRAIGVPDGEAVPSSPTSRSRRATTTSSVTRIGATGRATTCRSCPTTRSERCWTAIRRTRHCPTSASRPTAARSPTSTMTPPRSAIAAPASNTSPP